MEQGSPSVSLFPSPPIEEINLDNEGSENEYPSNASADNQTSRENSMRRGINVAITAFVVSYILFIVILWIRHLLNWSGK